ncbi:ribbon-helix-helix domain-containing protein [Oxyplasma meridianum]|uniref:Ribbon-helix-helix domain-containing protein n=1 Tax=Oxyplasma meridianum TaxID=3073602 RepID=A0AAX4NFP6_9ARCH
MDGKDTKLTIRISEADLEEIDEFLEKNSSFGSRSEFIRHAAIDFISKSRAHFVQPSETNVNVNRKLLETLSLAVEKGYFGSISGALGEIINYSTEKGIISELIAKRRREYRNLEESVSDIFNEDLGMEKGTKEQNDKKNGGI